MRPPVYQRMVVRQDTVISVPGRAGDSVDAEVPTCCGSAFGDLPPPTTPVRTVDPQTGAAVELGYDLSPKPSPYTPILEAMPKLESLSRLLAGAIGMPVDMYEEVVAQCAIWAAVGAGSDKPFTPPVVRALLTARLAQAGKEASQQEIDSATTALWAGVNLTTKMAFPGGLYPTGVAYGELFPEIGLRSRLHLLQTRLPGLQAMPRFEILAMWDSRKDIFGLCESEHEIITQEGLKGTGLEAITERIEDHVTDADWDETNKDPLSSNFLRPNESYRPEHHFDRPPGVSHADAFMNGKRYVAERKQEVKDRLKEGKWEAAEKALGEMLHARQDAYAHTNYAELSKEQQGEFREILDCTRNEMTQGLKDALKVTGYDPKAEDPGRPPGDDYAHDEHSIGHGHGGKEKFDTARKAAVEDTNRAVNNIYDELKRELGEDKAKEIWDKFGRKKPR